MPMKGNPNAVGQNQKSFGPSANVQKGSDPMPRPRGQMSTSPVSLNLKEFNRTMDTSAPPTAKAFTTPSSKGSGFEVKSKSMATKDATPAIVRINPTVRSNVKG